MTPFLRQQLDRQILRLAELDAALADPQVMADIGRLRTLTRDHARVSALAGRWTQLQQRERDLQDARVMLDDADLLSDEADAAPASRMSTLVHGFWIVGQCVIAVAFGAGLFVAFDQLWKWNNIVALVLSVLVILGLVVGVRVVRKTEDIGSTLIAVAVGALVTLGPLALLQSG